MEIVTAEDVIDALDIMATMRCEDLEIVWQDVVREWVGDDAGLSLRRQVRKLDQTGIGITMSKRIWGILGRRARVDMLEETGGDLKDWPGREKDLFDQMNDLWHVEPPPVPGEYLVRSKALKRQETWSVGKRTIQCWTGLWEWKEQAYRQTPADEATIRFCAWNASRREKEE